MMKRNTVRAKHKQPERDISVAIHEAGHAVAACVLHPDRYLYEISAVPDKDEGTAGFVHTGHLDDDPPPLTLMNEVIYLYAGAAATIHAYPYATKDAEMGSKSDNEKADRILELLESDATARTELKLVLRKRAADLVAEYWTAIVRIAQEVARCGRIPGEEGEVIFNAIEDGDNPDEVLAEYREMRDRSNWSSAQATSLDTV